MIYLYVASGDIYSVTLILSVIMDECEEEPMIKNAVSDENFVVMTRDRHEWLLSAINYIRMKSLDLCEIEFSKKF